MNKTRLIITLAAVAAAATVAAFVGLRGSTSHAAAVAGGGPGKPSSAVYLAKHAIRSHARGTRSTGAGDEPVDFNMPFADDLPISTPAAASQHGLTFPVDSPSGAGKIASVVVHRGWRPQAIGIVYDSQAYGHFYAIEYPATDTQANLEHLASSCDPNKGCEGSWNMVSLSDGTQALLVSNSPEATTIGWLHNGIELMISGPPSTLTADGAVALANLFEGSAKF